MTTHVSILTSPGSAAIAVLVVRGPGAWSIIRRRFQPARGELTNDPPKAGIRFGRFGDRSTDDVVLLIRGPDDFEIHCHGGRQVVEWLVDLIKSDGAEGRPWQESKGDWFIDSSAGNLLPFARTVRTASILLDQAQGAYRRAAHDASKAAILRRNAGVGRHLVEPWVVVIAGAPNAGKSTLLNALAGFSRSIVSPIPGTTRDAVSVSLAFDGWPVDVIDTAGMRRTSDELEAEGVERARLAVEKSDLCLWLVDATGPRPSSVAEVADRLVVDAEKILVVFNKCDLIQMPADELPQAVRISAATGEGLPELAARMAKALVPEPPVPGEPVPFTPAECDRWS